MTDEKQTLTPAEWKSVSEHLIELSEKLQQAAGSSKAISEPRNPDSGLGSSKD
jgi:hypothetical protein